MVGEWLESGWRVVGEWLESGWTVVGEWLESGWRVAGEWLDSGWTNPIVSQSVVHSIRFYLRELVDSAAVNGNGVEIMIPKHHKIPQGIG